MGTSQPYPSSLINRIPEEVEELPKKPPTKMNNQEYASEFELPIMEQGTRSYYDTEQYRDRYVIMSRTLASAAGMGMYMLHVQYSTIGTIQSCKNVASLFL